MGIEKRIINLRESKGWTQRELANRVNLNFSVMNRIESGERAVRDQELLALAKALDTTSDYLIGATDTKDNSIIRGKEEDLSALTDYQKMILEWAQSQPSLSLVENKEELSKILDDIAFIFEYERRKRNSRDG